MQLFQMKTGTSKITFSCLAILCCIEFSAQTYTSYLTGSSNDLVTSPEGGICLMGGASEDDEAMKWFLNRANGGDVLILRTSGADGYNDYMWSTLGISLNSVETIVCHNALASQEPYITERINQAEAIWFAGGDQWDYISFWRNTPINSAIDQGVLQRNIVIGGTSAGMAIQGEYYFSAQNGTVSSATATSNPYAPTVTVDGTPFITQSILQKTTTDTHFDNPNRKGRLITFMARIYTDFGVQARAIACDEYTAVCIDENGIARVFGGYPSYDDNAYFVQTNCDLGNPAPEICLPNNPLTWSSGGNALLVYQIKGNVSGSNFFDLNTWSVGSGGIWQSWSASNGNFFEQNIENPNCVGLVNAINKEVRIHVFPNPTNEKVIVEFERNGDEEVDIQVLDLMGHRINIRPVSVTENQFVLNLGDCASGVYTVNIQLQGNIFSSLILKD